MKINIKKYIERLKGYKQFYIAGIKWVWHVMKKKYVNIVAIINMNKKIWDANYQRNVLHPIIFVNISNIKSS